MDSSALWGFIKDNVEIELEILIYFYKILVLIGNDITPSNSISESMANYAFNCVSQSNSKKARLSRLHFFNEVFLNTQNNPNPTQIDILKYYELSEKKVVQKKQYLTLDGIAIQNQVGLPVLFGEA